MTTDKQLSALDRMADDARELGLGYDVPTPRTDAHTELPVMYAGEDENVWKALSEWIDFARTLERELAAAINERKTERECNLANTAELLRADKIIGELRTERDAATARADGLEVALRAMRSASTAVEQAAEAARALVAEQGDNATRTERGKGE